MGLFGMAFSYLMFSVLHFLQLVLALAVVGLYGTDVNRARVEHKYADSKWVYAVIVASLSALTSVLYFIPFILRFAFVWAWNLVLFILWIIVFAVFGKMYINENAEGDADIQRMKNAVWLDLVNALLWLVGFVATGLYWMRHRERRSRFTGRAKV